MNFFQLLQIVKAHMQGKDDPLSDRASQKLSEAATATHCVKDTYTNKIIFKGSLERCQQYQGAFGLSYIEEV